MNVEQMFIIVMPMHNVQTYQGHSLVPAIQATMEMAQVVQVIKLFVLILFYNVGK